MKETYLHLEHYLMYAALVPAIPALYWYKTMMQKNIYLLVYLWLALVADIIGSQMALRHIYNVWLYDLYCIFEWPLLFGVFSLLYTVKINRWLLVVSSVIVAALNIYDLFYTGYTLYTAIAWSVEVFFTILLCLYGFYDLIKHPRALGLGQVPLFWLCCAMLVMSSASLFVYIFSHVLPNELWIWMFHICGNIVGYIILVKVVWELCKTKPSY